MFFILLNMIHYNFNRCDPMIGDRVEYRPISFGGVRSFVVDDDLFLFCEAAVPGGPPKAGPFVRAARLGGGVIPTAMVVTS